MKTVIEYSIGIIGCGKMGWDLFEYLMARNYTLVLVCKKKEDVESIEGTFKKNLKRLQKYGLIGQNQYELQLKQTKVTSHLEHLNSCHLIIEAVNEDVALKKSIFKKIERIVSKDCIIASNTSSISPRRLFKKMIHPERCLSLHFFFPVKMKDFVEINMANNTSEETLEKVKSFLNDIGKYGLVLREEYHFLINRIFLKMQAGCCQLVSQRKVSYREIDEHVKAGLSPVGIFDFFDHVGIDVMLQSVKNYISYEPDPLFYQPMIEILEAKTARGELGKKTGAGFYVYTGKRELQGNITFERKEVLLKQIANWYLDGVHWALSSSFCTKTEIDRVVTAYMMSEKSPFDLSEEIGYTFK